MSNSYAIFARESTYNTVPSTGWRGLEINADALKSSREVLTHKGLAAARGAQRSTGRRFVKKKGAGPIALPGFSNGLGILGRTAASVSTSAVHSGGTLAYDQTFQWTSVGPPAGRSVSAEVRRERYSGSLDAYTYAGGRCVSLGISQDVSGLLQFTFDMDFQSVVRQGSVPSRTIADVDPDLIYAWEDATITIGEVGESQTAECIQSFNLTLPTGINTESYCLNKGTSRHEPKRETVPDPTGTLNWEYQHPDFYDAFMAGTQFQLVANWEGDDVIESTTKPSLTITLACIEFSGEDPEGAVDGPSMQNVPFTVLDNGTDPVAELVFVTSDADF